MCDFLDGLTLPACVWTNRFFSDLSEPVLQFLLFRLDIVIDYHCASRLYADSSKKTACVGRDTALEQSLKISCVTESWLCLIGLSLSVLRRCVFLFIAVHTWYHSGSCVWAYLCETQPGCPCYRLQIKTALLPCVYELKSAALKTKLLWNKCCQVEVKSSDPNGFSSKTEKKLWGKWYLCAVSNE